MSVTPTPPPAPLPGLLQYRTAPGVAGHGKWFNSARDLAYLAQPILADVIFYLSQDDAAMEDLLAMGVSKDQFDELVRSVGRFWVLARTQRNFKTCWKESGMETAGHDALVDAIGRRVLKGLMAWYHKGLGEVTAAGADPPIPIDDYVADLRNTLDEFRRPWYVSLGKKVLRCLQLRSFHRPPRKVLW